MVKNPPTNTGAVGSIPGLGSSSGIGNDNPFQFSCLENSLERGAWRAYSPRGHKELDTTEHAYAHTYSIFIPLLLSFHSSVFNLLHLIGLSDSLLWKCK